MTKEWSQFHPSGKVTVSPVMVLSATGFPSSHALNVNSTRNIICKKKKLSNYARGKAETFLCN